MSKDIKLEDLPPPRPEDLVSPGIEDLPPPRPEDLIPFQKEPDAARSAWLGALQGGTAGFAEEIEGAVKAVPEALTSDQKLADLYRKYRDIARGEYKQAKEAHPYAYGAGEVGGGLATGILLPGSTLAKAAGLGAATGLGTSEAELAGPDKDITGAAKDVALGAGLGGISYGIGKGITSVVEGKARQQLAGKLAEKASGIEPYSAKNLGTAFKETPEGDIVRKTLEERSRGIGQTALEEGTLPFMGGPKTMNDKVIEAINSTNSKFEPILSEAQSKLSKLSQDDIITKVGNPYNKVNERISGILDKLRYSPKTAEEIQSNISPVLEDIQSAGNDIVKLNGIKKDIWDKVREMSRTGFEQRPASFDPELSTFKQIGGMLSDHIEQLGNTASPGLGDRIGQLNQTFGNLQSLSESTAKLAAKAEKTKLIGAKELGLGGISYALHSPIPAALGVAGKAAEYATGQPMSRLAQIAGAKTLNLAPGETSLLSPLSETAEQAIRGTAGQEATQPEKSLDLSSRLYRASNDELKNVSTKLVQSPDLTNLGVALQKAINKEDNSAKNAVLFSIMQNPKARELLKQ